MADRPATEQSPSATPAVRRRGRGAHRASRSVTALVAALAVVVTVLSVAIGAGAFTAGDADASQRPGRHTTTVVGRVCGPHHPPAGWIVYRGSNGDRGSVRTDRGHYRLDLHGVGRGEWVSGTAFCPGRRHVHHVRAVPFRFFVPRGHVACRDIR